MGKRSNPQGRLVRFMLWADDEFGFDFTGLLIALGLAAVVGLALLIRESSRCHC
jgi:hypothetical protein